MGFSSQLVSTIMVAGILYSLVDVTGKPTSLASCYATAGWIAAGFISVFCSFRYIQISDKLLETATDPSKASRVDVVKSLKNGIIVNLLGLGSAFVGIRATAVTSYKQGIAPGNFPVLALDVYWMQVLF